MCGINGIIRLGERGPAVDEGVLARTRDAMAARGPDGTGLWIADDRGVGLGHRRLAIIDLSDAGAQPMAYEGGRYRLIFNGEIYNYKELRADLERAGVRFASTSDSEVILALYHREREAMLHKLRGMFTLAIWDGLERRLLLARDPYGIKPLYLAEGGGWLQFASQVKALEAGGRVSQGVDPRGVAGFLLWGSVPEPLTVRRAVRALPAGHLLVVRDGRVEAPRCYHDVLAASAAPGRGIPEAAEDAVRAHLVADVPVAVFLSAGIDSSLVAALARRVAGVELTTVTARFEDYIGTDLDEGPVAAATARMLGTRHVETTVSREELRGLWPQVSAAMDQPSVDGFNTFVVSRVVRDAGFKVVLSGLGGDELFGGYRTFRQVPALARRVRALGRVPGATRAWDVGARALAGSRPKLGGVVRYGGSIAGAYFLRRGLFLPEELPEIMGREAAEEALRAVEPVGWASRAAGSAPSAGDDWVAIHRLESALYMRNQLLRDSDWASMAHSLELRVPWVDAALHATIAALGYEPGRSGGKPAVARVIAPELPPALVARRKTGFAIPTAQALVHSDPRRIRGGLGSREIALRVLETFGADLRAPAGRS